MPNYLKQFLTMRALLVYPVFPQTFWSYDKILELVDRKVLLPPLGSLVTS